MTFNPTDDRKAVVLDITDDQLAERNEVISLQLTELSSNIGIGQRTTRITIQDDEGKEYFAGADLGGCSGCSSTPISCKLDYVTALEALAREVSYSHCN